MLLSLTYGIINYGVDMKKEYSRYTLRMSPIISTKIQMIAERNGRSKNKEIEMTLKKYILNYERENGPLEIEGMNNEQTR